MPPPSPPRTAPEPESAAKPDSPTDIEKRSWKYIVVKTVREFTADQCMDAAAALTYYAVLSVFPAMIAIFSLLGVVGQGSAAADAVIGIIDDVARRIPSGWQDAGENIYLLGVTATELSGSAWAGTVHGHLGGRPPAVDLGAEKRLAELIQAASQQELVSSAHDLSAGGLGQALAEASLRFGVGARVWLSELMERDGVDAATALFSESTGRVIVSVPREEDVKFRGLCEGRGYPVLRIGVTDAPDGADAALEVQGLFTLPLAQLRTVSTETLPAAFGPIIDEVPA